MCLFVYVFVFIYVCVCVCAGVFFSLAGEQGGNPLGPMSLEIENSGLHKASLVLATAPSKKRLLA